MSTQSESAANSGATQQKKTVTVVAYAEHDAFDSERDMADELDGMRDYYARDYRTSRTVELVFDDGDDKRTEQLYTEHVRDALVEAGVDHDDVTVREETSVSRPYKNDPSRVAKNLRDDICSDLPDKLAGEVENHLWSSKWQDDDRKTKVRVRNDGIDYRRVLAHHSERNGRRKYDGRRKHLSASFTIELGPEEPEIIDAWSDEVVAEFVKGLANTGWVRKVRMADCVESIEQQGDCFDV